MYVLRRIGKGISRYVFTVLSNPKWWDMSMPAGSQGAWTCSGLSDPKGRGHAQACLIPRGVGMLRPVWSQGVWTCSGLSGLKGCGYDQACLVPEGLGMSRPI